MISAQVESFKRAIPELQQIISSHWEELALFQEKMPLKPQWDEYVRREESGNLFLATVRKNAAIVAYYIAQVAPGFHYSETLVGTMDIAYVVPHLRERGLAIPLFRCVEREMKRRGVKVWYSGFKANNPMGMDRLLTAFGFAPADIYCAKWIGP